MEEAFELISTGAWSIVPPLLALALALITKEVYSSLTIGVFVGMVIYQFTLNGAGVEQLVTAFTDGAERDGASRSPATGRCCCSLRCWAR